MEGEKLELEVLNEVIKHLTEAVECASECDTVSKEEYRIMANYLGKLENEKMKLEISIESCRLEDI